MSKRKTFTISIIASITFAVLLSFVGFDASCREIKNEVLRLHIVANSDSDADQSLKLKVRDRVLDLEKELWKESKNKEEAIATVNENLDYIVKEAQKVVNENGYSYPVKGEVAVCSFPTKNYKEFTLPAGYYDALKITIGEGKGKNWWCVLFPEICLGTATDFKGVISEESENIVRKPQNYKVKFKVIEVYHGLKEKINSIF